MAKKRKAKKKAAKSKKRAAPARKKKVATRKPKVKSKGKRRTAKTKLPPRASKASRPMTQPGPAVTPLQARPSPFPSSMPSDFPTRSVDGKD